jgi:hypothetical protein
MNDNNMLIYISSKYIHRDIKRKLKEVDQKWNQSEDTIGPCETHLFTYGKVKELTIGSFGDWFLWRMEQ